MDLLRAVWPFRRFELETSLSPDEVATTLGADLDPDALFLPGGSRPWLGSVSATSLAVRRRIHYRNSFLPRVRARIARTDRGARLDVSMAMHPLVVVFVALWMSVATLGACAIAVGALDGRAPPSALLVLVMPLAGAAAVALGFGREATRAEAWLRGALPEVAHPTSYRT